jgi:hypothetical protein
MPFPPLLTGGTGTSEALLALAELERVTPLLHRAAVSLGPSSLAPPVRLRLAQAYTQARIANFLAFAALAEILRTFASAGIPAVTLKGAALAVTVYEDPACRSLGDLDLLVPPAAVPAAVRLLVDLGYAPLPGRAAGAAAALAARTAVALAPGPTALPPPLRHTGELTFRRSHGLRTQVDLHWALTSRTLLRRTIATSWFWEQTRTLAFPDAARSTRCAPPLLRIFTPEAQLLHLCAHTLQHGRPRLRWTYDIALLLALTLRDEPFGWEIVIAGARRNGLTLAVRATLDAVAELWGVAPPAWVQAELAALPVSRAERRLLQFSQSGDSRALAAFDILCQPTPAAALWLALATLHTAWFAAARVSTCRRLLQITRGAARAGWGALRLLIRRPPDPLPNSHRTRNPVS